MKIALGKLTRALVYSEIWIGIACAAQVAFSFLLLDLLPDVDLMLLCFFATVAVYNGQRLVKVSGAFPEVNSERHEWKQRNRSWLWMIFGIACVGVLYNAFDLSVRSLMGLGLCGVVTVFYTLPISSKGERRGLRELAYAKLFLVAVSWAMVTAFFPLSESGTTGLPMILLVTLDRAIFIMAITIPFDIRDLPFDNAEKKTLPQVLGQKRALKVASDLLIVSCALCMIALKTYGTFLLSWTALLVGYAITWFLVRRSEPESGELHFTGLLDGTMILIPALLWLVRGW